MRSTRFAHTCVAFSVAAVAFAGHASAPDSATQKKIAAMSVPFVPNAGQWNERAAFAAQTFAGTLFVTKQGELVYSLPGKPLGAGAESVGADSAAHGATKLSDAKSSPSTGSVEATPSRRLQRPSERSPAWALTETLVDSKGHARPMRESTLKAPAGYRPMEGKVNFAIGNNAAKHTNNLNTYERVNLGDMYPGINVQLCATGNNVEKIFTVAPQQDPKQINIAVSGADKLEMGRSGELIAHTGNGLITFTAPIAFQENEAGERVAVNVRYVVDDTSSQYSFAIGHYDTTQALVIDPLLQSSYFGGALDDFAASISIHPASGEVYVVGQTDSTDLPGASGGAQSAKSTNRDVFVARFNANLASAPATCNLDIDQDGHVTAATDGLMVLRRMLGLSGAALAAGAANPVGTQTDPDALTNSINTMLASQLLDIDGSGGAPNAATDGLMLVRAMLGFRGSSVTNGAIVGAPPRNTWPLIRDYLNQNCGTNFSP